MPKNLLEQLREMTVVVADTGDIQAIEKFTPRDATTNPSLITAAAQMPQYRGIVDATLKQARLVLAAASGVAEFGKLGLQFGNPILEVEKQHGRSSGCGNWRTMPRKPRRVAALMGGGRERAGAGRRRWRCIRGRFPG